MRRSSSFVSAARVASSTSIPEERSPASDGGAPQLRLLRAELAQLFAELLRALPACVRACIEARLEARGEPDAIDQDSGQPLGELGRARVASRHLRRRALGCGVEVRDLRLQRATPRLELEEDRLGRLARVPELAAGRVECEPFAGHRELGRPEELLLLEVG